MSYLYGDSTPSALEVNFIELLREALEFSVQVLLAEHRVTQSTARARTQEQAAAGEIERLERLGTSVARALEGAPTGESESATERCASAILRSVGDIVRGAIDGVRSALSQEIAKLDTQASRERDGCFKALEALLLKRDLPDTSIALHLGLGSSGHYACRARATTGFGLEALMDLEIGSGNLYAQALRLDRVVERLEVNAPEVGGWLHKEVKMRVQRLERFYMTDLSIGPDDSSTKLRAAPDGTGGGFDITFQKQAPRVQLYRIEERNGHGKAPYNVPEPDAGRLLAVQEKLVAAAVDLARHRKAIVSATIDGEPLNRHEKPSILVERLVSSMAPVVQEIAARSLSPGELVLRRQLADDRREEIFVSKAELKRKLDPLPETMRAVFEPLWREAAPAKDAAARRPAPVPLTRLAARSVTPPLGSPVPSAIAAAAGAPAAPGAAPPPGPGATAAAAPAEPAPAAATASPPAAAGEPALPPPKADPPQAPARGSS